MNDRLRNIEPRTYRRAECVTFQKTSEEFGGLSNMAPGFPLQVNGLRIGTSEVLYQACRFPHLIDVQRMLLTERSPMTAKMKSKPFRQESRPDFEVIKVTVMRWCLRIKLLQNRDRFARLLLATGERPIVEVSRKDPYWGAQVDDDGDALIGGNVMGRLLMELREYLRSDRADALRGPVAPPPIPVFLLLGIPIGTVTERGERASFTVSNAASPAMFDPARSDTDPQGITAGSYVTRTAHGVGQEVVTESIEGAIGGIPAAPDSCEEQSTPRQNKADESGQPHLPPQPLDQDVTVRFSVSYYGQTRQIRDQRLQLSGLIERLVDLWGRPDELEELELNVKCRPGSEQRVARVLRGHDSAGDGSNSDEEPQLQLFTRLRHD